MPSFGTRALLVAVVVGGPACSLLFRDYDARFDGGSDAAPVATAIVTESVAPGRLAISGDWLFYVTGSTIRRIALDAGAGTISTAWSQEDASGVSALAADDAGSIAWALQGPRGPVKIELSNDSTSTAGLLAIADASVAAISLESATVTLGLECGGCSTPMAAVDRQTKNVAYFPAASSKNVGEIIEGPNGARFGTTMSSGLGYLVTTSLQQCTPAGVFGGNEPEDVDFASGAYFFSERQNLPLARVPVNTMGCPSFAQAATLDATAPGPGLVAHSSDGVIVFVDSTAVVWRISSDGSAATKIGTVPSGSPGATKAIAVGGGRVFVAVGNSIYALDVP